jgi:hypothetical protein
MKHVFLKTDKDNTVELCIADGVPLAIVLCGLAREPGLLTPENEAKVRHALGVAEKGVAP